MRLLPVIILTLIAFPGTDIPIILLEEGLTCSRITSESVEYPEITLSGAGSLDGAGNYYTIETLEGGPHSQFGSMIVKHAGSGEERAFAMLRSPPGFDMLFEALTLDRRGNMFVTVLSGREGGFSETRDYYRIEGLPKSEFRKRASFAIGVAALMFIIVATFIRIVILRLRFSRRAP